MDATQDVIRAECSPVRRILPGPGVAASHNYSTFTNFGLEQLRAAHVETIEEREWSMLHTPRNLAMVLSAASGELAEMFKWEGEVGPRLPGFSDAKRERVTSQLATLLLDIVALSDVCGVDLGRAAASQLQDLKMMHQDPQERHLLVHPPPAGPSSRRATSSTHAAASASATPFDDSPLANRNSPRSSGPFAPAPPAAQYHGAQAGPSHPQQPVTSARARDLLQPPYPLGMNQQHAQQPAASVVVGYPLIHAASAPAVAAPASPPVQGQIHPRLVSSPGATTAALLTTYPLQHAPNSAPLVVGLPAGGVASTGSPAQMPQLQLQHSWSSPVGDQPCLQGMLTVAQQYKALQKQYSQTYHTQQQPARTVHVLRSRMASEGKYPAMYQPQQHQQPHNQQQLAPRLAAPVPGGPGTLPEAHVQPPYGHQSQPLHVHALPHALLLLGPRAVEQGRPGDASYMYPAPGSNPTSGIAGREGAFQRRPQEATPAAGPSYQQEVAVGGGSTYMFPVPHHLQPLTHDPLPPARTHDTSPDHSQVAHGSDCQGSHAQPLGAQLQGLRGLAGEQGGSSPSYAQGTSAAVEKPCAAAPSARMQQGTWAQQPQTLQPQPMQQEQQPLHGSFHTLPMASSGSGENSGLRPQQQPPTAARANTNGASDLQPPHAVSKLQQYSQEDRQYPAVRTVMGGTSAGRQVNNTNNASAGTAADEQQMNSGIPANAVNQVFHELRHQQLPAAACDPAPGPVRAAGIPPPEQQQQAPLVPGRRGPAVHTPTNSPKRPMGLVPRDLHGFADQQQGDGHASGSGTPASGTPTAAHAAQLDQAARNPFHPSATTEPNASKPPAAAEEQLREAEYSWYQDSAPQRGAPQRPTPAAPHYPLVAAAADARQQQMDGRRGSSTGPSVFATQMHPRCQPANPVFSKSMVAAIAKARAAQREAQVVAEAVAAAERVGREEEEAVAAGAAAAAAGAVAGPAAGDMNGPHADMNGAGAASISHSDALRAAELVAAILQVTNDDETATTMPAVGASMPGAGFTGQMLCQESSMFMDLLAAPTPATTTPTPPDAALTGPAAAAVTAAPARRVTGEPVQAQSLASEDVFAAVEAAAAHAAHATEAAAAAVLQERHRGSGAGASVGAQQQLSPVPAMSGLTALLGSHHELCPSTGGLEDGGDGNLRLTAAVAAAAYAAAAAGVEGDSGAEYGALHHAWQLSASPNEGLMGEEAWAGLGVGVTSRLAAGRASNSGRGTAWPTTSTCAAAAAAVAAAAPPSRRTGPPHGGAAAAVGHTRGSGSRDAPTHRPASPTAGSVLTESYTELVRMYRGPRGVAAQAEAAAAAAMGRGAGSTGGGRATNGWPAAHHRPPYTPSHAQEHLQSGTGMEGSGAGGSPLLQGATVAKRKSRRYTREETQVLTQLGNKYGWVIQNIPQQEVVDVLHNLQIPYLRMHNFIQNRRPPELRPNRSTVVSVMTSRGLEGVPVGRGTTRPLSHIYPLPGTGVNSAPSGYLASADPKPSQRRRLNSMTHGPTGPGGYALPGLGATSRGQAAGYLHHQHHGSGASGGADEAEEEGEEEYGSYTRHPAPPSRVQQVQGQVQGSWRAGSGGSSAAAGSAPQGHHHGGSDQAYLRQWA